MKPKVIILYEIRDLLVEAQKECKVDSIILNKGKRGEGHRKRSERFEER